MLIATKRTVTLPAILTLTLAVASGVRAEPDCEAVELPALGGQSLVTDLAEDGRIVGAVSPVREDGTLLYHGALWEDGKLVDLGTLDGRSTYAIGINRHGTIVGLTSMWPEMVPVTFRDGKVVQLPLENDDPVHAGSSYPGVVARDLNDRGQVIGHYVDKTACLLWRDVTARPERLRIGKVVYCESFAINDRGEALLQIKPSLEEAPFVALYRDGRLTRVTLPERPPHPVQILMLNDEGTVAGTVDPAGDSFSWSAGRYGRPPVVKRHPGMVIALNDRGDIALAGQIKDESGAVTTISKLTLARANGRLDDYGTLDGLYGQGPEMMTSGSAGKVDTLTALNDRGQLAWTKHRVEYLPLRAPVVERHAFHCQLR